MHIIPPMACTGGDGGTERAGASLFTSTHWTVVLTAGQTGSPLAAEALEKLCRSYWYPLYAYVRRRGYAPEDARDLTQEFFWRLLDGDWLPKVDPSKGKFRSFLLASMNHFLANEWDRANAIKRGGRVTFQPLEDGTCEQSFRNETKLNRSPDELYELSWAKTLLQTVLSRLKQEAVVAGHSELFREFEGVLAGEKPTQTYAELAVKLSTTEAALKMAMTRLRHRYGQVLREEIALTVAQPEEVESELRYLLNVFSR